MSAVSNWPELPYDLWHSTCDTLHAHTQVLGKLAVGLAAPEPQLQHAALRLTARGWETAPLPAPDGSGALVAALDLHAHDAVVEHSDGRSARIPLTPDRPVAEVTREVLQAVRGLVGPVRFDPTPQETPWTTPLDEDNDHATYDVTHVNAYFAAATQAALVLGEVRAPYRGRSTPVNAWWGTFDLAVGLYSGEPADAPSNAFIMRNATAQMIEVGWWPGDERYPRPAFFAFAFPAPEGFERATISPAGARWDADLQEFLLDWEDARSMPDPRAAPSSSHGQRSATPAWSAAGIPTSPRAPTVGRRRSHSGDCSRTRSRQECAMTGCRHLDDVAEVAPNSDGCEDCLRIGGGWVHLRMCMSCGHVGCCDNSPNRHATAHFTAEHHPIIQSYEPGEDWWFCYVDDLAFVVEGAPSFEHR